MAQTRAEITAFSQTARWNALLDPGGRVNTESYGGTPFDGELKLKTFDSVHICTIRASPHRVVHRHVAGSDPRLISAIIQLAGQSVVMQNDRTIALHAGQWCLHYTARPYAVINSVEVDQLLVMIPQQAADMATQHLAGTSAGALLINQGCGRLLYEYARTVFDQHEHRDDLTAETTAKNIVDIFNTACAGMIGSAPSGIERSFERAKAHIDKHFQDVEFKIETVAQYMNCTKRYLHKIFAEHGGTIDGYIWRLRMMRAVTYLESPVHQNISIADVSYASGFGSTTHFNALFKKTFGMTPSQYRAAIKSGQTGPSRH